MAARKTSSYTVKDPVDLAIDAGNGTTCVVSGRGPSIVFPSVIQQVETVSLDGHGTQGFTVHIETDSPQSRHSFAVGDTATLLPGLKTRNTSKDRIGSDYQRVLILAGTVLALEQLLSSEAGEVKVNVNWWLNIPPVYFRLAQKLYDLAGQYRVEYNHRVYRLNATVGHVYPEGVGAGAAYMLDEQGQFVNTAFTQGRTGVVDGGYRTIDSAIFEGAVLLESSAYSLTNSISGVYQLMQQWAMEAFEEEWTEEECESNLRHGYAVLRHSKQRVDLTDWIADLGERLADLIERDVFQKQWGDLSVVDRVFLAGGVAYMVAAPLKERYPHVVVLREEFPHTAHVPYELMNAEGHMRLLLAELAIQQ